MTVNRAQKKAIRDRKERTGEPYMEARRQQDAPVADPLEFARDLDWTDALLVAGYSSPLQGAATVESGPVLSDDTAYAVFTVRQSRSRHRGKKSTLAKYLGFKRVEVEELDDQTILVGIPTNSVLRGSTPITGARVVPEVASVAATGILRSVQRRLGSGIWSRGIAEQLATKSGRTAWVVRFTAPAGPPADWARDSMLPELCDEFGAKVLIDHRGDDDGHIPVFIVSDIDDVTDETTRESIHRLATEDSWRTRWENVLGEDGIRPRPEHDVYQEATVGSLLLRRQPFVVQQGLDPFEFFIRERNIATTLAAAPFLSVTGYPNGEHGERHPQAFSVTWADTDAVIPHTPEDVPVSADSTLGQEWLLAGMFNRAFDEMFWARPEVFDVKPVAGARKWDVSLRLYSGMTKSNVSAELSQLQALLGTASLEIIGDGPFTVTFRAGDNLRRRKAAPKKD